MIAILDVAEKTLVEVHVHLERRGREEIRSHS